MKLISSYTIDVKKLSLGFVHVLSGFSLELIDCRISSSLQGPPLINSFLIFVTSSAGLLLDKFLPVTPTTIADEHHLARIRYAQLMTQFFRA
jgi:hypothetical protein